MFEFVDVNVNEIDVEPVNKDGVRYYPIPGADKYYPSVTSITSFKNAKVFKDWRKKLVKKRQIVSLLGYKSRYSIS